MSVLFQQTTIHGMELKNRLVRSATVEGIADPGFVELIRSGSTERSRCIHCNLCLAYMISYSLKCYNGKMIENGGE